VGGQEKQVKLKKGEIMFEASRCAGRTKNNGTINPPEYLQTIIDSATDPILIIDTKYRISLANRHIRRLIGEVKIEPTRLHCYEVTNLKNKFCNCSDNSCPVKEVINKKVPVTINRQEGGTPSHATVFAIEASPVFNDVGEVTHVIKLCRTNGKSTPKTAETDPPLNEIAHGVNNVLTTVAGYASLLKVKFKPGEEIYELLTVIERAGDRGNNLIKLLSGLIEGKKFCCQDGSCQSNHS